MLKPCYSNFKKNLRYCFARTCNIPSVTIQIITIFTPFRHNKIFKEVKFILTTKFDYWFNFKPKIFLQILHFQSLVAIPQVKLEKSPKLKYWVARVWLVEELFYYNYPFYLPNIFQTKLTKDQLEVRFKFIQGFSSVNIEKVFFIQEFLSSYSSLISNQRKNKIKKYFIQLVHLFKEHDLIEDSYKIISNGFFIDTDQLTISNISQGFVIYERLSV
nr:hypothetical protein [Haslea silbo]